MQQMMWQQTGFRSWDKIRSPIESLLVPGLFDGEHIFSIEPLDENRVRFVQREKFSGLLVPLFARSLERDTKRGFDEMNKALKARVEQEL